MDGRHGIKIVRILSLEGLFGTQAQFDHRADLAMAHGMVPRLEGVSTLPGRGRTREISR